MTSSEYIIKHIAFWFGMLLIGSNSSIAIAAEASATVEIRATFIAPTCELSAPSSVMLKPMRRGDNTVNDPFDIQVNCTSPSNTSVYAELIGGQLNSGSTTVALMNMLDGSSPPSSNRVLFSLQDPKNGDITLNGDTGTVFCGGTNSRTCTLEPKTRVPSNAQLGLVSSVIRFNIRYEG
ncbi:hypothetical protein D6R50_10870 [Aeromonas veronii]|uniref:Fimbrial protein n=2 Tax=Aeromonas veronii TaxID=654 RepID=A0A3A9ICP2_AERVE|nr:hypothetical protein [Aeromonas veronii]RKJ86473.1 hypothetical protein D6R50_19700 [Aeromonas veronii]RKJ89731.1 hypothetical protein D6R50_10870 [Aeromonas veronii]